MYRALDAPGRAAPGTRPASPEPCGAQRGGAHLPL